MKAACFFGDSSCFVSNSRQSSLAYLETDNNKWAQRLINHVKMTIMVVKEVLETILSKIRYTTS